MPVVNPYLKSNKRQRRREGTEDFSSPSVSNPYSVRTQAIQPPDQQREVNAIPNVQWSIGAPQKKTLNPYAKSKPAVPENLSLDNRVPSRPNPPNLRFDSNHHAPPASTHQDQSVDILSAKELFNNHLASTVPGSIPLQTPTSGLRLQKTPHEFDPSFDDSGIDWDAAIQIMDQTANRRVAPVNNSMAPPSSSSVKAASNLVTRPPALDIRTTNNPQMSSSLSHPQEVQRPSVRQMETSKPQGLELPSQWTTNASKVPPVLQFSEDRVKPVNDEYRQALVQNANLSATLDNGWKLYSHQKRAILKALLMRRCILALDCGLGKTIIGCVWAKSMQRTYGDLKVYVICPVSMTQEWKRTAQDATGLIVASDKADKENLDLNMQICSWGKVPIDAPRSIPNFVVVCDEAHSMQSLLAQRTQSVLQLIKSPRCVGVLLLSGTPMKNGKPSNLFPLLKAVNHPFGDNQKSFETYFCAGHQKQMRGTVVWDASGSSNLADLNKHISSHLLYLSKDDVLSDLPPQTRETRQVPVSSRHQLQHNQALADLARIYSATGSLETSGDAVLTAVQKVRMIGSFSKIDATVGLAKEVLQNQPAVIIFTCFAQVAKNVHKQLADSGWEGCLLTGETPSKKRQGLVDSFQQGLSPVFVSTFGAGGVGLTLTAAHTIILLDRPWTPGEAQQAVSLFVESPRNCPRLETHHSLFFSGGSYSTDWPNQARDKYLDGSV
jgi:superfamily II DNA or RNA helicase